MFCFVVRFLGTPYSALVETRLEFSDFLSQFKRKPQNSGELYPGAVNRTCKELIVVKGFNQRPPALVSKALSFTVSP